ncbi:MAG: hypothetical protein ACOVQA_06130 [Thermoflexibacteraceae bacterium]
MVHYIGFAGRKHEFYHFILTISKDIFCRTDFSPLERFTKRTKVRSTG